MAKNSSATHHTLQKSSTLNRRYVRRPQKKAPNTVKIGIVSSHSADIKPTTKKKITITQTEKPSEKITTKTPKISKFASAGSSKPARSIAINTPKTTTAPKATVTPKATAAPKVTTKPAPRPVVKKSAEELKDRAIKQALKSVATMEEATNKSASKKTAKVTNPPVKIKHHTGRKIFLALACSALTVAALGFFVHLNMPDISVKVAAMQTGIEAKYPSFVPRDYHLKDVSSEKGTVINMIFAASEDKSFTLTEEKSSWDSHALLNNYVKKEFSPEYTIIREQGITVYIDAENAVWVSGGILYKISATGVNLTKEQIKNIVVSL